MKGTSGLERRRAREGQLAILGAAVAWSTAGLAQRELEADAATQVAGRSVFAAIALAALVFATERRGSVHAFRSMGRWGLAMAVFLAISSGTFFLALNYTTVANVLFMQAAAPMMAALLGWVFLSEKVDLRTSIALALAGVGVLLMAAGSFDAGVAAVVLPFVMTASFAVVIVIARHRREVSMMPATATSQVLVVLACVPFVAFGSVSRGDWAILAALGVGQMGLGLALLTIGARLIPPAQVAVISLLEIVLGPLWVWLAYEERPTAATLMGGVVVVGAVVVQLQSRSYPTSLAAQAKHHARATGGPESSSADVFDDLDQFVEAVTLAAGEGDELLGPLDDGAAFGRPRDGDATPAAGLE